MLVKCGLSSAATSAFYTFKIRTSADLQIRILPPAATVSAASVALSSCHVHCHYYCIYHLLMANKMMMMVMMRQLVSGNQLIYTIYTL